MDLIDRDDNFGTTPAKGWDSFIDSLADAPVEARAPRADAERYTCGQCAGTGLWQGGRTNRHGNNKCLACKGKGYFTTAPRVRERNRAAAANRKASAQAGAQADNITAIGGEDMLALLADAARWSEFASSLMAQHRNGKTWSEKQVGSIARMLAKLTAKADAKKAERSRTQAAVDLAPIRTMFEAAVASGYKRPTYRAEGLVINRAPDHGNNPGALYVKSAEGEYLGKVLGTTFTPARGGAAATTGLLAIAADPLGAAVRYGNRTGTCACCGRKLTKGESIARGIGPICAARWGLEGMQMHPTNAEARQTLDAEQAALRAK